MAQNPKDNVAVGGAQIHIKDNDEEQMMGDAELKRDLLMEKE